MTTSASNRSRTEFTDGYVSGPAAATEPRRRSLERIVTATRVVLVEGVTDQIALERLALRTGRDLVADGVVIAPMGGAHAIETFLRTIDDHANGDHANGDVRVGGLCDRREADVFRAALTRAGAGSVVDDDDLERLGFHVCDADLEHELIRALGVDGLLRLVGEHGDLGPFRTLQKQAPWLALPFEAQLHRFLRSKARRMHHYAAAMIDAVDLDRVPAPLVGALGG